MEYEIKCRECGDTIPVEMWRWKCECGGTLDISMDYGDSGFEDLVRRDEIGIRRYSDFLPLAEPPQYPVGDVPILEKVMGRNEVVFQLEYLSPGGSFKDRGAYVSVTKVVELWEKELLLASSGNSAISFSLMGTVLGARVHTFVPSSAPLGKKHLLRALGAVLHEVEGGTEEAERRALEERGRLGVYVGHWWNPYFLEGTKTMAYEAHEKIGEIDHIVVPVGTGTAALGLYKGFKELLELGKIEKIPSLSIVQACGYADVCEEVGSVRRCEPTELAGGIAVVDPPRKEQIASAVKESDGAAIVVDDNEIEEGTKELLESGFIVEPTSAAAYAGMVRAVEEGMIGSGRILLPLTGTGMKVGGELAGL